MGASTVLLNLRTYVLLGYIPQLDDSLVLTPENTCRNGDASNTL